MELGSSKTKENLMRAFAGESMARNRYTFSAAAAKKDAGNERSQRLTNHQLQQ